MTKVILVDEKDNQIGSKEKIAAHMEGLLHRAFSIFVFNDKQELLLQKRALKKYHSGGLWSNTCCSHPAPGEDLLESAHCRLIEEMGFDCELKKLFSFSYKTTLGCLTENEYDHVILGNFNGTPSPSPSEAADWKWVNLDELDLDLKKNPQKYTYWFQVALPKLREQIILHDEPDNKDYRGHLEIIIDSSSAG